MTALFDRFGTDLPPLDGIYLPPMGRRTDDPAGYDR